MRIALDIGPFIKHDGFPIDSCKAAAVKAIVSRGGIVISQDSTSIDLQLEEHAIMVQCQYLGTRWAIYNNDTKELFDKDNFGFVIVTGPDNQKNHDLGTFLVSQIFPAQ